MIPIHHQRTTSLYPTMSSERHHQEKLFEWAGYKKAEHPELKLLFAVPNGQYRRGERPEAGLKAGVPDVCLPVPRGDFGALFIEMKHGRNKPTAKQMQWLDRLVEAGNLAVVCHSWHEAADTIETYLASEEVNAPSHD